MMALLRRVSPRREFRRPFPVHDRARHWEVGKFLTIRDVFASGDAAKENHFGLGRQFRCQMTRVALDWHSVTRIVLIDVDLRKFTQIIEMNSRSRIYQPACRRDHKHT